MAILAPKPVSRCPRCLLPIQQRARIEVIGTDHRGQRVWAHEGCKSPADAAKSAKAADAALNGALGGDDDVDAADAAITNAVSAAVATLPEPAPQPRNAPSATVDAQAVERLVTAAMDRLYPGTVKRVQGAIVGDIQRQLDRIEEETADTMRTAVSKIDSRMDAVADALRVSLMEVAQSVRKTVHVIQTPTGAVQTDGDEVFNDAFWEILELAEAGENLFIPGPTGCGKTHMAEQVSRYVSSLDGKGKGRRFGMISGTAGVTESSIMGTSVPNLTTGENVFVGTEFIDLYENGGVFLVDEADAMDANVLLSINAAIANGYMPLPKRTAKPRAMKHPKFVILFAANTWGRGADRMYVGRNKMDAATLDRFIGGTVPVDYCEAIERRLCPDAELFDTLMGWRKKIMEAWMQRILSTRFVSWAYRWKNKGIVYAAKKFTRDQGWTREEMQKVLGLELTKKVEEA
jgi:MoxR-like ATPase